MKFTFISCFFEKNTYNLNFERLFSFPGNRSSFENQLTNLLLLDLLVDLRNFTF